MKGLIEKLLRFFSRAILRKYRPRIIGITGSVGKTGTREAIYSVIAGRGRVRRSRKNYNNEIGVPVTIIGTDSPGRNPLGWITVFLKAVFLTVHRDKEYPETIILEMGVDHPKDMDYLNTIVGCDIAVLTAVSSVHLEFFKNRDELRREKAKIFDTLPESGTAVYNYDNEEARRAVKESKSQARRLSYGLDEKAEVQAYDISYRYEEKNGQEILGANFSVKYQEYQQRLELPRVLGLGAVYSALAGAAVGLSEGMDLGQIADALRSYRPPRGRMNIVKGVKNTTIIDDSYNSEPQSAMAALSVLKRIPAASGARKFAVLGDMLELGPYSEQGHREVGRYAVKAGIDKLIVVGERARDIARGAEEAGLNADHIFRFPYSREAGIFLQRRIKEHDLVLVKGSQGARMERIVKEIMAEPLRAEELLVRHDRQWLRIP